MIEKLAKVYRNNPARASEAPLSPAFGTISPFFLHFLTVLRSARRSDRGWHAALAVTAPTVTGMLPRQRSARHPNGSRRVASTVAALRDGRVRADQVSPPRASAPPPIPERSSGGTAATGRRRVAGDGMMSHSWKINDSQRFKGTKHYPRPCHGFRYALHRASSLRARACQNVALANAGRRSLVALTGFAESCLEGRRIAALLTSTLPEPPHLSCSEKQHDPHPAKRPQGDCGFPSKLATSRPFPRAVGSGRRRAGCRPSGSPPVCVRMAGIYRNRKI